MWKREFSGHELEIGSLLYDESLCVFDKSIPAWVPFDPDMIFFFRGNADSVLLRKGAVKELWNFNSELIPRF